MILESPLPFMVAIISTTLEQTEIYDPMVFNNPFLNDIELYWNIKPDLK